MNKGIWLVIGLVVLVVAVFAGLAPLPGEKDEPSPHVQPAPAGQSPEPTKPAGPPTDSPANPGQSR
jgi:hypothetical protein